MKTHIFIGLLSIGLLGSCKTASVSKSNPFTASTQTELLDANTFKLTGISTDQTYGYTEKNPIASGGGPTGGHRFLNALTGPNGEKVTYTRLGSCCPFHTPNGLINKTGLLDRYEIQYEGLEKAVVLYLNMYDSKEMQAPVGFAFKQ